MAFKIITQDPADKLDYTIDWTTWLNGDSISSVTWAISPTGSLVTGSVGAQAATFTGTTTTCFLLSGTLATSYDVTTQVITAASRTKEYTYAVVIMNQ